MDLDLTLVSWRGGAMTHRWQNVCENESLMNYILVVTLICIHREGWFRWPPPRCNSHTMVKYWRLAHQRLGLSKPFRWELKRARKSKRNTDAKPTRTFITEQSWTVSESKIAMMLILMICCPLHFWKCIQLLAYNFHLVTATSHDSGGKNLFFTMHKGTGEI